MGIRVADELYYDIDGQLAEIKRQLRQAKGYPFNPFRLKVMLQNAIEWKLGKSLFPLMEVTKLEAVEGKKTRDCFTNPRHYYDRDDNFDLWLPANQSKAESCVIMTLSTSREDTALFDWASKETMFIDWIGAVLGAPVYGTPIQKIEGLLKERGHIMTLPQIEELMDVEKSRRTGMTLSPYSNNFFVENEDGSVSLARLEFGSDVEDGQVRMFKLAQLRLFDKDYRCLAGDHLFVRNLDPAKLG